MFVSGTFNHFPLFLQGYFKSGMIKAALYLMLSMEVNMGQAAFTHLNYLLMCSVR